MSIKQLFRELLSNGGETNAVQDYSVTPGTFEYIVPTGKRLDVSRVTVSMSFTGKTDILYYGPISSGLTNGVTLQIVTIDGVNIPLSARSPAKSNYDLGIFSTDGVALQQAEGTGQNDQALLAFSVYPARFAVDRRTAQRMWSLEAGAAIQAILNDDFSDSAWLRHEFQVNGRLYDHWY